MAVLASFLAGCCDHRSLLGPGERGVLPVLAATVDQARQAFNFIAGAFDRSPCLRDLVENRTADTLSLTTAVDISVRPASFRSIRGITAIGVICDEIAFWRSDDSANPDKEILAALRPSLATTRGPLIAISSPYGKKGELWNVFRGDYGADGDPAILVAKAASREMNPSLAQSVVDRAMERDSAAADAEYGGNFRTDLEAFVSREAVEAAVEPECRERPPVEGVIYASFIDAAGGSGADAMTLAIAHVEDGVGVLDLLRGAKPPFSPEAVVAEFAETMLRYGVIQATAGGEVDAAVREVVLEEADALAMEIETVESRASELHIWLATLGDILKPAIQCGHSLGPVHLAALARYFDRSDHGAVNSVAWRRAKEIREAWRKHLLALGSQADAQPEL